VKENATNPVTSSATKKDETFMQLEVLRDAETVAARAAAIIAENARAACHERGLFLMAVSGGHTPWMMLSMLANEEVPWAAVHIFQVDERIAPAGDPDRNLTHLRESLLQNAPLDPAHIHPMPVESRNPAAASAEYAMTLQKIAVAADSRSHTPRPWAGRTHCFARSW
jgi:6-phosphogluconolactonase